MNDNRKLKSALIVVCAVLFEPLLLGSEQKAITDAGNIHIEARLAKQRYEVGEPIVVDVTYRNTGTSPCSIIKPDESDLVGTSYTLRGRKNSIGGRNCAGMLVREIGLPNGDSIEEWSVIIPPRITIAPGGVYAFKMELYQFGWCHVVCPGSWVMWFRDGNLDCESKRVEFDTYLNRHVFLRFAEIADDMNRSMPDRVYSGKWLHELRPDFALQWPQAKDSEDVKQEKREQVPRDLADYRKWLGMQAESQMLTRRICDLETKLRREKEHDLRSVQ